MSEKEVKTKVIEASAITITDSLSSVELTRTAGGEVRPKVKVYNTNPILAEQTANDIMDRLNKKYRVNE